jgi:predicted DNA-binding transcriptional regulator YafY
MRAECELLLRHVQVRLPAMADATQVQELLIKLSRSCAAREMVRICFERSFGISEHILLQPYEVAFLYNEWFVAGYDVSRRQLSLIRMASIASCALTGATFSREAGYRLEKLLGNAWQVSSGTETYKAVLRFDRDVADDVDAIIWHPSQSTQRNNDGSLMFEVTVSGLEEIAGWIMSFGGHVDVLQPVELRELVESKARRILETMSQTHPMGGEHQCSRPKATRLRCIAVMSQ